MTDAGKGIAKWAGVVVVVVLIGGLGVWFGSQTKLEIEGPGGVKAKLDVAGRSVDYERILSTMWESEFLRDAAQGWLARHHGTVWIKDQRLASTLEAGACDTIPATPLEAKLRALETCANQPSNRALRDLALDRHGYPFHPVGVETRFTVPEPRDVPRPETASVCERRWLGQELEVLNPQLNTMIKVQATGRMNCSGIRETGTQMHLNPEDARKLLGDVEPLGVHRVYVVPVG